MNLTAMDEGPSTTTMTTVSNEATIMANSSASLFADNSSSSSSSSAMISSTNNETENLFSPTVKTNDTISTATTTAANAAAADIDTLAANSIQMTTSSSSSSSSTKAPSPSNPCSNDNPDWEEGTQPCLNSTTDYIIFDGAVTTPAATVEDDAITTDPTTTFEQEEQSTNQNVKDLPSSYSCYKSTSADADTTDSNNTKAMYLRFDYEIYTIPNQTTAQLTDVLSIFEKQLGYGVASAVGLTDCPVNEQPVNDNGRSDEQPISVDLDKRLRRRVYNRRSLQEQTSDGFGFVEVSIEPLDVLDTTLLACTSETTLDNPSQCTPIHGFMTAHYLALSSSSSSSQTNRQLAKLYEEQTPEQYLLSTIETYMTINQTHYITEELLHVSYVGERDLKLSNIDPGVLARPVGKTVNVEEAYPGSKYVGIGVAGIFIMILLAGLIYSYREEMQNRQSGEDAEMELEQDVEEAVDEVKDDDVMGDGDGAFPTMVNNMDSMAASDGGTVQESPAKLLLNESNVSNESSIPPTLDPYVPTDNLFGLQGKVFSDEYPEPALKNDDDTSSDIDVFEPLFPTTSETLKKDDESDESQQMQPSSDGPKDDDSAESAPNEAKKDSQESSDDTPDVANDPNWAGIVNHPEVVAGDTNISPSEATAKMSNSARFLFENGSSDIEDGLESDEDDDTEKVGRTSLPSFV